MKEQSFIPYPPVSSFRGHKAPEEILEQVKYQQHTNPLLTISRFVGAGQEYMHLQPCKCGVAYAGSLECPKCKSKPDGSIPVQLLPVKEATDTNKQGWYIYYEGLSHPKKGFPTPHAVNAIGPVKRILMNTIKAIATKDLILAFIGIALTPRKYKVRILERILIQFNDFAHLNMWRFYFEPPFKQPANVATYDFVRHFLYNLKVNTKVADNTANIVGHLVEYDDAYRYRIQDVMSETNKEKLLANPSKEVQRILQILMEREQGGRSGVTDWRGDHVIKKAKSLSRLGLALYIPFVKKAFKYGIENTNITDLQMDEMDRYNTRLLAGYNFDGESYDVRVKKYPVEQGKPVFIQ